MRILIAEDDKGLREVIQKKMKAQGFSVDIFSNGEDACDYLIDGDYDVAVLDIMMPKMDGIQVVREIRDKGISTPVIFLTAKDTIADKVKGLDVGANDYVVKPFAFEELFARIRAVTRTAAVSTSNIYSLADLTLDVESHIVMRNGKEIELTGREYSLLEYLMVNKGKILSRAKIEDHVWGLDYPGGGTVVDVYINYLRKKIDQGYDKKLIFTVRGIGFVLKEEEP